MNDPRELALQTASRWLDTARRRALRADECAELVDALGMVPGLLRTAVQSLSCQRDAAAVEALLALPPGVPGWVEALYGAFANGVARPQRDGAASVPMLAMDFRRARSAAFDDAIGRARAVFGDALEQLEVDGREHWRFVIDARRGTLAGRAAALALDLQWLHGRLARIKGTRTWLNGWCFDAASPVRPTVQIHLLRAWLSWAAKQVHTAAP